MSRFLALTLVLAFTASAGCGKKPEPYTSGGGGASAPPVSAGQSGPSDPAPIDPATVGSISGVVKLEGWLKPDGLLPVGGIPYCASCHPNGVRGEALVLDGQTMANVFVHVKSGLGNRAFPVPKEPVTLDQVGCMYTPHVRGLRAGQPLLVRNSDNLLHNVTYAPALNKGDNKGQTSKGAEDIFHFPIPETGIFIKCDVHPWMGAWLHVVTHPYYLVTGKDGAFTLKDLPPGDYEIEAIHEKFPGASLVQKAKLEAKGNVKLDFKFKGGAKPDSAK